jgi:hypothetical protein
MARVTKKIKRQRTQVPKQELQQLIGSGLSLEMPDNIRFILNRVAAQFRPPDEPDTKACGGSCEGKALIWLSFDADESQSEMFDLVRDLANRHEASLKRKAKERANSDCEAAGGQRCKCSGDWHFIEPYWHYGWTGKYAGCGWRYSGTCREAHPY